MMNDIARRARRRSGVVRSLFVVSVAGLAAGCSLDSVLEVSTPDLVPGDVASHPDNLASLRNGVLFEFARALTGPEGSNSTPGIVGLSGIFTDEQWYSSTFSDMQAIDQRTITRENPALRTVFGYIHRARNWADVAAEQFAASEMANTGDHALVTNLGGYAHFFLSDNWCSGVPLSRTSITGAVEFGPARTTTEIVEMALEKFRDAASIAQTANSRGQLDLARMGQARALLSLGRVSEAAAMAETVTPGFVYMVEYSELASGQSNGIWGQINSSRRASLASEEGSSNRGLRYFNRNGTNAATMTLDPRVPVLSRDVGTGTSIPVFRAGRTATRGAGIPLASYVEARLIVAESLLGYGMSTTYLEVLNELRAEATTHLLALGFTLTGPVVLPPLTDPGTAKARVRQLFDERAFWLHLTGQRLGDVRRMIRSYGFTENEVFPTGVTVRNVPFGTDINFPIPFVEGNNPAFQPLDGASGACLDRQA